MSIFFSLYLVTCLLNLANNLKTLSLQGLDIRCLLMGLFLINEKAFFVGMKMGMLFFKSKANTIWPFSTSTSFLRPKWPQNRVKTNQESCVQWINNVVEDYISSLYIQVHSKNVLHTCWPIYLRSRNSNSH